MNAPSATFPLADVPESRLLSHLNYFRIHLLFFVATSLFGGAVIFFAEHARLPFTDTLFTAVSAMTVTGLTTQNFAEFSFVSKVATLLLIQVGSVSLLSLAPAIYRRHSIRRRFAFPVKRRLPSHIARFAAGLDGVDAAVALRRGSDVGLALSTSLSQPRAEAFAGRAMTPRAAAASVVGARFDFEPSSGAGAAPGAVFLYEYSLDYLALSEIIKTVLGFIFGTYLVSFCLLYASIVWLYPDVAAQLDVDGIHPAFFCLFHVVSAFCNAGFALKVDNLVVLADAPAALVVVCFLIVAGNTLFPFSLFYAIRFRAVYASRRQAAAKHGAATPELFQYIFLRCRHLYTHLFPPTETRVLLLAWLLMTFIELASILIEDWGVSADLTVVPGSAFSAYVAKAMAALFTAISTRSAGFNVVSSSALGTGTTTVFVLMMILTPLPFVLTLRKTSVAEDEVAEDEAALPTTPVRIAPSAAAALARAGAATGRRGDTIGGTTLATLGRQMPAAVTSDDEGDVSAPMQTARTLRDLYTAEQEIAAEDAAPSGEAPSAASTAADHSLPFPPRRSFETSVTSSQSDAAVTEAAVPAGIPPLSSWSRVKKAFVALASVYRTETLERDLVLLWLGWWAISALEAGTGRLVVDTGSVDAISGPDVSYRALFEVASAYGNVGLSMGYPTCDVSFAGALSTPSKLVMMLVCLLGRHRGLPLNVDSAISMGSLTHRGAPAEARRLFAIHALAQSAPDVSSVKPPAVRRRSLMHLLSPPGSPPRSHKALGLPPLAAIAEDGKEDMV
jgi:Trk-type K+ transport system membrane component